MENGRITKRRGLDRARDTVVSWIFVLSFNLSKEMSVVLFEVLTASEDRADQRQRKAARTTSEVHP